MHDEGTYYRYTYNANGSPCPVLIAVYYGGSVLWMLHDAVHDCEIDENGMPHPGERIQEIGTDDHEVERAQFMQDWEAAPEWTTALGLRLLADKDES